MLPYILSNGRRPDLLADLSRTTQFNVELTPIELIAAPRLSLLPGDLQKPLKRQFFKRRESARDWDGIYAAQAWLAGEVATLEREKLHVAFDDWEIRARAEAAARLCQKMTKVSAMQAHARALGLVPPEGKTRGPEGPFCSLESVRARLQCPRWWRRQFRKVYTRRAESHLRALGIVQKRKQVYASDRAVNWRRERKTRDRALLQEMQAVSDAGDQLELWDVVQKSQANPALRRGELMVRARGFEECAETAGHRARFFTVTCPSAFHKTESTGAANPRYQGFTPREGQDWLCRNWARARAKLKRLSIQFYGFRVAEPHHDGTPHWHLLLFGTRAALRTVAKVLSALWFAEYREELTSRAAKKARFDVKAITRRLKTDGTKTSATGYIAKYIAKNIDGFAVGEDFEANNADAASSCERVQAWASVHGIRQFQQIGGPAVTVWRELRRLHDSVGPGDIEAARQAADAGEWSQFIAAVGGIEVGRGSIRLDREITGELTQYGELRAPCIVGVMSPAGRVRTRVKCWRIERKGQTVGARMGAMREGSTLCGGDGGYREPHRRREHDADASVSSLGPVSTTVRPAGSVPGACEPADSAFHRARGVPWIN